MIRFNKKHYMIMLVIAIVASFGVSIPVFASSAVQAGETATIAADQTVDGAAFLAGTTVTIDGTVKGDVFCAGNKVIINGTVDGDVLCAAITLNIRGTIKGNVRAVGQDVFLHGEIGKAATIAAASTIIADTSSSIKTDALLVTSDTVALSGVIERDVRVATEQMMLGGTIGRNVDGDVGSIVVNDGAKVGGNLTYSSERESRIPEGVVAGKITHTIPEKKSSADTAQNPIIAFFGSIFVMIVFFVPFTLLITLVMPRYIRTVTANYDSPLRIVKAGLVGLATFAIVFPVIIILLLSIVGFVAGLFLLVLLCAAVLLVGVVVSYRIGLFVFKGRQVNMFAVMVVGALAVAIVTSIPLLNIILVILIGCIGMGMIVLGFRSQYDSDQPYATLADTPNEKEPSR